MSGTPSAPIERCAQETPTPKQAEPLPCCESLQALAEAGTGSTPQPDMASRVGGKAAGLIQLLQCGLPVPEAFVIQNASAQLFPADLDLAYQAIGAGRVAVRSSALGEDGNDASFAGQFDTLLNIEGPEALRDAISTCVNSLHSAWAQAYSAHAQMPSTPSMCVIVQRMVEPRVAGVLFTANPVSGRHDRLVIDAVAGLGEALMSGTVTPDHYELDHRGHILSRECITEKALLNDQQLEALAKTARQTAIKLGQPLDMEWAIDETGTIRWLQARPITTLGSDLNELDTPLGPDQVVTRCNIGEMMPGAVSPLTFSVQARGIEYGMQHMHVSWRARPAINNEWSQICQRYGHLFINMSGSLAAAHSVGFSNAESIAQSLCGRTVEELREPERLAPWWRRQLGSLIFLRYCFRARHFTNAFERRFKSMRIRYSDDRNAMMQELDRQVHWVGSTHEVHLRSSAYSAVMEGIIQRLVSGSSAPPNYAQQAEAARLLAGARDVESAVLVQQLDDVVDRIAEHADAEQSFAQTKPAIALQWLQSSRAGAAAACFSDFLQAHGHRGFRELCLRERGWADEPEKLIITMQASLAARLQPGYRPKTVNPIELNTLPRALRHMLPKAHDAIRQREHTKSLLVMATHRLKRGYRHLGAVLASEGLLADADLVFFFTHEELQAFCAEPGRGDAERALARRRALEFQQRLSFAEISVGPPEPEETAALPELDGHLNGRPVSRGVVEGRVRVCMTLEHAAALQPGEILVAPVTDVGWTPYFSLIAGLATDVGSAVSHGAVIAREYGLPAIVNLRVATQVLKTGDYVKLDADQGNIITIDRN